MLQRLALCGLRSVLGQNTRSLTSLAVAVTELSGANCPRQTLSKLTASYAGNPTANLPFSLLAHGLRTPQTVQSVQLVHVRCFSATTTAPAAKAAKPVRKAAPKPLDAEATARAIVAAARKAATAAAAKAKAKAKAAAARAKERERKERLKQKERTKKAKAKARESAKKDAHIRRPASAYNLFLADYMAEMRASGKLASPAPRAAVQECFTAAAKRFKELPEAQRKPYLDRAAAAKASAEALRAQRKSERAARYAPSAYMLFYRENFTSIRAAHPELKTSQLAAKLGEAWRTASEEVRKKFVDTANAERVARGQKPRPTTVAVAAAPAAAAAQAATAAPAAAAAPAAKTTRAAAATPAAAAASPATP